MKQAPPRPAALRLNALPVAPLLLAALLASPAVTQAHHAFAAEFDAAQPIEVTGTVTRVRLTNPHSWLYIDITDASGKTVNWGFEFGAPFALQQRGLTRETLPVGTKVKLKGYRAKSGQEYAYGSLLTLPDGRTLQVGGAPDVPAAASAPR